MLHSAHNPFRPLRGWGKTFIRLELQEPLKKNRNVVADVIVKNYIESNLFFSLRYVGKDKAEKNPGDVA